MSVIGVMPSKEMTLTPIVLLFEYGSASNLGVATMQRTLLVALLVLFHGFATAGVVPQSAREELFNRALEGFWGRARMPDGTPIQPTSEQDRRTFPVNKSVANFAFDVGELSGLAQWCALDWQANFTALTRSARKNGQTEKQVAFISVLHGVAQGTIETAMSKSEPCAPQEREKVRAQVERFWAVEPK